MRLRRGSPLKLNLNLSIVGVDQVVLAIDPLVAHDIGQIYIHVTQSFLAVSDGVELIRKSPPTYHAIVNGTLTSYRIHGEDSENLMDLLLPQFTDFFF